MNIDESYKFVQFVSNKEQNGYIDPNQFNSAAKASQLQLFMERVGNPADYMPGRPIPPVAYQMTQKIGDDLRPFVTKVNMLINKFGKANFPSDYVHPTSIRYKLLTNSGCCGKTTTTTKFRPVDIIAEDKLSDRLGSALVPPTKKYPICSFYSDYIQFYPEDLRAVDFTYLRFPKDPKWGFTMQNGRPVYNPSSSVDFEFPEITHNEIIVRILSFIGINLREGQLLQYGEMKQEKGI